MEKPNDRKTDGYRCLRSDHSGRRRGQRGSLQYRPDDRIEPRQRGSQERQRQERAQGFPEQAQTGGTTLVPLGFSQPDTDRLETMPPQGETPTRIETGQDC
jgi:hypothetical protein